MGDMGGAGSRDNRGRPALRYRVGRADCKAAAGGKIAVGLRGGAPGTGGRAELAYGGPKA